MNDERSVQLPRLANPNNAGGRCGPCKVLSWQDPAQEGLRGFTSGPNAHKRSPKSWRGFAHWA